MKGFRFRLDPILALRRSQEEQLQRELSERQREFEEEAMRLEDLNREIASQTEMIEKATQPGDLDLDGMVVATGYIDALRRRAEAQRSLVEARTRAVEECRILLLSATAEKRSLEKLKERQESTYQHEMARREQLGIEEIARMRYLFRSAGEAGGGLTWR